MRMNWRPFLILAALAAMILSGCKKEEKYNQVDEQGRKQGEWRYHFETGELEKVVYFEDDIKKGAETRYFPTGTTNLEMNWEGDSFGVYLQGDYKHYYDNGQVLHEMSYDDGVPQGKVVYYYKNGKKEIEGQYNSGMKSGVWKYYRQDGTLQKEVDFTNYEQDWNEDFKAGVQTYYSPDGKPFYTAIYEANALVEDEVLDLVLYQQYSDNIK